MALLSLATKTTPKLTQWLCKMSKHINMESGMILQKQVSRDRFWWATSLILSKMKFASTRALAASFKCW